MLLIFLASTISGILEGANETIYKKIVDKKYSSFSYGLIQWGINALLYFFLFILFGKPFPTSPESYIYLAGLLILYICGNTLIIKAYKTEEISNLNVITHISLVISFISGVFVLNEKINIFKIIGLISVIIGIVVIFYEGKKFNLSIGYLFALLSGSLYGLTSLFLKKSLITFNIFTLLFLFNLCAAILLLLNRKIVADSKKILVKHFKIILISRFFLISSSLLYLWGLNRGNISIINTNSETLTLLTTVFVGVKFLNENKNLLNKFIGVVFCSVGIYLLNFL